MLGPQNLEPCSGVVNVFPHVEDVGDGQVSNHKKEEPGAQLGPKKLIVRLKYFAVIKHIPLNRMRMSY